MAASGVLRDIAAWLGGSHDRSDRVARGKRDGIAVTVRHALRGTGYERTAIERRWTELDVQLPPGYPLSLYIRRHDWTDDHQIEQRKMVDVAIGDPAFDRLFLIEAAPAQIARRVLGPPIRRVLAQHEAIALTTETRDDRVVLHLAIATWLDQATITAAIDALVAVAAGVRDAYAAIAAEAIGEAAGSPYRPELEAAQVDARQAAMADEVERVARLRGNR